MNTNDEHKPFLLWGLVVNKMVYFYESHFCALKPLDGPVYWMKVIYLIYIFTGTYSMKAEEPAGVIAAL